MTNDTQSVKEAERHGMKGEVMDSAGSMITDWTECPEVERVRGRYSGALTFHNSRMPVASLIANLAAGASVEQWAEWYGGDLEMAKAILEFLAEDMSRPWTEDSVVQKPATDPPPAVAGKFRGN